MQSSTFMGLMGLGLGGRGGTPTLDTPHFKPFSNVASHSGNPPYTQDIFPCTF